MNEISPVRTEEKQSLTEFQQTAATKMSQTVIDIAKRALGICMTSLQMTKEEFVATHIDPVQEEIKKLNERANAFFKKMLLAVEQQMQPLYKTIESTLLKLKVEEMAAESLKEKIVVMPQEVDNIPMIQKFMEAVALPCVKNLLEEFDTMNPSIVNDITGIKKEI